MNQREQAVPATVRQLHATAITRMFRQIEELLEDYRAVADEASYQYAASELDRLGCEAAENHLSAERLVEVHERLERQKLALARAVEEWREGFCR